ncbi:MAG TPA: hypothetical protein PKV71_15365 [Calditrichia bacterium]|nr:hypothetical protein [Calditrichia bacterium]HQV33265.1 hypothetical protein [Calditrichia bacterium]
MLILGFYYWQASRSGLTEFLWWSVFGRGSVIIFLTAFVLMGFAKPVLILFGAVDLVAALWTAVALRSAGKG